MRLQEICSGWHGGDKRDMEGGQPDSSGLWGHRGGSVALPLALLLPVLVLLSGAAIDIARWLQARDTASTALSAAAFAGGRTLQLTGSQELSVGSAREAFLSNLAGAGFGNLTDAAVTFQATPGASAFVAHATAFIDTPMLSLVGIKRLQVLDARTGSRDTTRTAAGAGLGTSTEVAVVLDLAAASSSGMLDSLKAALHDLVDIVVWPERDGTASRLGLVPFADAVNAGSFLAAATGGIRSGLCTTPGCRRLQLEQSAPGCLDPDLAPDQPCGMRVFTASACVSGRYDAGVTGDVAPGAAPLSPYYPNASGVCRAASPVVPLTTDKAELAAAIDALQVSSGAAAPHLGVAWAWYLLSPEWASLWPGRDAAPYQELRVRHPNGKPRLRKVAVLVHSGTATMQQCRGVDDHIAPCPPPVAARSVEQVRQSCVDMRRRGIELFVVGVGAGGNRSMEVVLRDQCAGRDSFYYAVETGDQLRQALRDIALEISPLELTQ